MQTKVLRAKKFDQQLSQMPKHIRQKIMFWIFLVENNGIAEVAKSPGFHDKPLQGDRWGQRSIRLNRAYRLIYRVTEDRVYIEVLEVHKHDY